MALEITGNIDLGNGIILNSAYARTLYEVNHDSSSVTILTNYWIDRTAYEENKTPISPNFTFDDRYFYNRTTDGDDVLSFTQLKIKEKLEGIGLSVVITDL